MRTAIISDIHGNYEGLLATFDDIKQQNCNRILCLGDLVDGGPNDEKVVQKIIAEGIVSVKGNHDVWPSKILPENLEVFLQKLPKEIIEDDICYIHVSPRRIARSIKTEIEAWNVFDETHFRIVFIGHTHIPEVYGEKSNHSVSAKRHPLIFNTPYPLDPSDRYIISVGAIGYSRDHINKISYGIYDKNESTIEIRRIDGTILNIHCYF